MGSGMKAFSYSRLSKLAFYGSYFWYKLILPLEVRSPRFSMWFYEIMYTLHKFIDYEYCRPWRGRGDVITTRFGAFRVRRNTADAANVSPAFERRDLNRLLGLIADLTGSGKKVLFLDVGGDIGTYSITVANRFQSGGVRVCCFEPVPASCELIRDNIARNGGADRIELFDVALMDERNDDLTISLNAEAPGSSGIAGEGQDLHVRADRLDHLLASQLDGIDAVVMKIDVEGAEKNVLEGAAGLLQQPVDVFLMVEDFIDSSIIEFLENRGWSFMEKLTDYNSWWVKHAHENPDS